MKLNKTEQVSSVTLLVFALLTGFSMLAHSESAIHWGGFLLLNYVVHMYIQYYKMHGR